METLGLRFRRWSRGGGPVERALADCPVILVLIRDDAIEPFLETHDLSAHRLIHASGSLRTPRAAGMHPLYTFGPELYDDDVYPRIPFICDADGPPFAEVFPDFANPSWTIDPHDRPRYHAACVMGGNFTTLLWSRAMEIFAELGLPSEAALPYLERTCANVARHGPGALTGPLARGDRKTISANLAALAGDPWRDVYRAIVEAVRPELGDQRSEEAE
jgi:predicted short-subunit dehydrogenase-like oxidoreductase (DUF2520 family)